jgi:hypothetical protein
MQFHLILSRPEKLNPQSVSLWSYKSVGDMMKNGLYFFMLSIYLFAGQVDDITAVDQCAMIEYIICRINNEHQIYFTKKEED